MSLEERYQIFLELAAHAWRCLAADDPARARKKWELVRRQHDDSSHRLAEKFRELAR